MIDEAFMPFRAIVLELVSFRRELVDEQAGVRSYVHTYELELPVEFDVARDGSGRLQLGSTPPLYDLETTFKPAIHRLTLRAELDGDADGD